MSDLHARFTTWFVPYGYGGTNGPHWLCNECNVLSVGNGSPQLTWHLSSCKVLPLVRAAQ